jgi:endonuclease/exonuclease/phosphatase family metal-dependent hydrolase
MAFRSRPFSLLQMNLCLSGLAACLRYPDVVREAVDVIDRQRPNAVALNEICRDDVAHIAGRTGYRWRFTGVPYLSKPLPCRNPAGRGLFGNAVLTKAAVARSVTGRFTAQDPLEQRRWLCVTTTQRTTVCTTHLEARISGASQVVNRRQCAELAELLAVRAARGPTLAAGDINRYGSCAPEGMWTRTDRRAAKRGGIQHIYGNADYLRTPVTEIVPATSTDHDFLQATARLVARTRP